MRHRDLLPSFSSLLTLYPPSDVLGRMSKIYCLNVHRRMRIEGRTA